GGWLAINSDEINPGDNAFRGDVELNGGRLSVNTASSWRLEGRIFLHSSPSTVAQVDGAAWVIGDGFNVGDDAQIHVDGSAPARILSPVTLRSDAELEVATGAKLEFHENTTFQAGVHIAGAGDIHNRKSMTVADGFAMNGQFINSGSLNVGGMNQPGSFVAGGFTQAQADFSIEDRLNIELFSSANDDFDQLVVNGAATLGGTLAVEWLGVDLPHRGDDFPILTAESVAGAFETLALPPINYADRWLIDYSATSVTLKVVANIDINLDSVIDGADFLAIQQFDPALIPSWEEQFGNHLGGASTAQSLTRQLAVPEPPGRQLVPLGIAAAATLIRRRTSASRCNAVDPVPVRL
ncbi:MAG: hypothetical protein KDA61_22635, partial [Planctomycetales bacterium]|nr:hypothetical protein [Planctomycetales bacterium]